MGWPADATDLAIAMLDEVRHLSRQLRAGALQRSGMKKRFKFR
jgi:hypothetical protein